MTTTTTIKRIATYERVSSEDQKLRETIKNQTEQLARSIEATPGVLVVHKYVDDGVSGTIPMAQRPDGMRLMEDAAKGRFDEVWVWKIDRLGRDDVDPLLVWRELEKLGVQVRSITEGISDQFMYHIHVAMAAKERRTFMEPSAAGIERTVKSSRFPGGICPLGYEVVGRQSEARLVVSERIIWSEWTAADLVRQIYQWLGVDHWSCPKIAKHLNALGVPTAYQHHAPGPSRAERKTGLQANWRAGRIRNLVVLSVYKGVYQYGKRSSKQREVWEVSVPALVPQELWQAAQEALARNRIISKNTPHHYLLTGLMKCGDCGKSYCATHGRDSVVWWRCNGRMLHRYDAETRCQSKGVKGTQIEAVVWRDIEQWLGNPGDLLDELQAQQDTGKAALAEEAERTALQAQLVKQEKERRGYHRQNAQGLLRDAELQGFLSEVAEKKAAIEKRLAELMPHDEDKHDTLPADLLDEIRRRLEAGLSEKDRQEIARLLVKRITVKTRVEGKRKQSIAEVEYRFPDGAVNYRRGNPAGMATAAMLAWEFGQRSFFNNAGTAIAL
ncbi:MAG: recombinase family protein [Chloroflexi bacterium]|nr:recombinase family protein [Chloroflexota bacterium]